MLQKSLLDAQKTLFSTSNRFTLLLELLQNIALVSSVYEIPSGGQKVDTAHLSLHVKSRLDDTERQSIQRRGGPWN